MSEIIAFPNGHRRPLVRAAGPSVMPPVERAQEALRRLAEDIDQLDPEARRPFATLLAAIDETGEIRARRRARAAAAYHRTMRPAGSAESRLRNPLSASWLPTLTAIP